MAVTDDYLWDRTGEDEDAQWLEKALEPLAYRVQPATPGLKRCRLFRILAAGAAAAAILLLAALFFLPRRAPPPEKIVLSVGAVGTIRVEPHTVVKVLRESIELVKLRLDRGTIHVDIARAAPRVFVVETPVTTCIDLGCRYTLTVEDGGRATVTVTFGSVAFADNGREVFIPSGASCTAVPRRGSGTPVWNEAPVAFSEAVRAYDRAPEKDRLPAARAVVAAASLPPDTLSVWHLLQDPDPRVAELALEFLEKIEPLPQGVPRQAALSRDPRALEALKEHLHGKYWRRPR